ncbi:hypothetical protein N0V93_007583 [Gnomoniopsis smithogilvyi]|uniref:Molybdate-anion transporter n=1 Tax=Gnomoniopsis smithogilvyi TaxID=1191159 RepID=A0A9W9CWR0_9PEZI|nr:hypothetical protein N0V93_007583 [Gnomoniopsis smithogilvyi]
MDLYKASLASLVVANGGLGYLQYRSGQKGDRSSSSVELEYVDVDTGKERASDPADDVKTVWNFKLIFMSVYALVMGADWLQGPYQYALYKDERQLPEQMVAALFAVGFVCAGISASIVGSFADKYGRRQMCLVFCVLYWLSCITKISDSVAILFVGRVLGGVSTTLLYSVFEAWMIHEHISRDLENKGLPQNQILSQMTTCSSVVAIIAGVVGHILVDIFGTNLAPFMASAVCLSLAFVLILRLWSENYGSQASEATNAGGLGGGSSIRSIMKDKRIVSLGVITCLFEGTMYLFVFFWSAALKSARALVRSDSPPPFGLIFSTFMCAMMLGSQISSLFGGKVTVPSVVQSLSVTLLVASTTLSAAVYFTSEFVTLWSFCFFEMCVGLYFPAIGYLRGQLVHGGIRGYVYGLLRLPLNVFVFVALMLTQEGQEHRGNVFLICSALLIVATVVTLRCVN